MKRALDCPDRPVRRSPSDFQRAGWLEEFVAELIAFPGGHDDQVDALPRYRLVRS